jgi:hypothetical protein
LFATTVALGGGQALAPASAAAMDGEESDLACLAAGGAPATGMDGQELCVFNDGSGGEVIPVFGVAPSPAPCPARSSCLPSRSPGSGGAGLEGRDRPSKPGEPKGVGGGSKPAKGEKPFRSTESVEHRFRRSECELVKRRADRVRLDFDYDDDLASRYIRRFLGTERQNLNWLRTWWKDMNCDAYLPSGFPTH